MSDEVPETPEKSLEESSFTDSSSIIESSLIGQRTSNNDSFVIRTPARIPRQIIESDSSEDSGAEDSSDRQSISSHNSVVEEDKEDDSIIEISSPELLHTFNDVQVISDDEVATTPLVQKVKVSSRDYFYQKQKVDYLHLNVIKTRNLIQTINVTALRDKGAAVINKLSQLQEQVAKEEEQLGLMEISTELDKNNLKTQWQNIEVGLNHVQPRTFGKQAMETLNTQKSLTMDRLEQLHGSLTNCPDVNSITPDPEGLKNKLMQHQQQALTWLLWREKQKPSGGILADDMGLGKTLTMLSLTLKSKQIGEENVEHEEPGAKYAGGTLIVAPATLIYQWRSEIETHVRKHYFNVEMYHGTKRETKAKRLSKYDIVITTYSLVMGDYSRTGPLFSINWKRIILDEAHQIRNHKSQTSVAVCNLLGQSRWVLTGTPIHNRELDLYALLKFLKCSPFDDLAVWKRWVANKSAGGQDRLNTVIASLMLRRTKVQLVKEQGFDVLPQKTWKLVEVTLNKDEMGVYQKMLVFSRTLFAQYLHQRAEKNADALMASGSNDSNLEYAKMHQHLLKINKIKTVKQTDILVLLLRLRQICCHPSLISKMLERDDDIDIDYEESSELNLLEQLNNLNLEDVASNPAEGLSNEDAPKGLAEASKNLLNPTHPIFKENSRSSKMIVMEKIVEKCLADGDKIILISQWTKMLNLIAMQLKKKNIIFSQLDGSVVVSKRMDIVQDFNSRNGKSKVLLLSLTAGGVGLNLIGANNLLLIDLHWNPQLEIQAQDRIYRVGQTKPVNIYKLMALDTVEQRIKQLQDNKLAVAENILTGAKIPEQKLSLDDLKMLFGM